MSSPENKLYPVEDWWIPHQLKTVEDRSKKWDLKIFSPQDGCWIKYDGGKALGKIDKDKAIPTEATLEKDAWDHEHCELCFETISPSCQKEGFTDGNEWVCVSCFEKYIKPRINS